VAGSGAARIAGDVLSSEFDGTALRPFLDVSKELPGVSA